MTIELGKMIRVFRESKNLSRKEFCNIVNISTSGLAYYENGGRVPSGKVLHKIRKGFGLPESYFTSEVNKKDTEKGELTMSQEQMLIKYQQKEIKKLKQIINQEDVYGGIQSDIRFAFEVKFNWSIKNPGVKVKYLSQDSEYIPMMAKKLGYTELEMVNLLQIDEFVEYKNHKIHTLRTEKQKEEMLGIMDNFMNAYRSIKVNTTMLVAEIPVLYNHKNGTIFKSNVEYRVNWIKGTGTAHIRWLQD